MGHAQPAKAEPGDVISSQVEAVRNMFGPTKLAWGFGPQGEPLPELLASAIIAIVDDQPINVKIVQKHLKTVGYQRFVSTTESREALDLVDRNEPDVIFLDIMMPYLSGLDILATLRKSEKHADLPVIILTAATDRETQLEALRLGATEFLHKPFDPAELEVRLRNVLTVKAHRDWLKKHASDLEAEVAVRSAELVLAHREVVRCLAAVGEFRDNETGRHTMRVGRYAQIIARFLGLDRTFTELIGDAAPLHDIGKVGIPDAILLKPGRLETTEFDQIERHCVYGRKVCSGEFDLHRDGFRSHTVVGHAIACLGGSPILAMAGVIALSHHERWDGKGYPRGVKGDDIPIEGRITAVADVFDALASHRPYKPAFSVEKSLEIIRQQSGTHFDPEVVAAFFAGLEEILAVYHEQADPDPKEEPAAPARDPHEPVAGQAEPEGPAAHPAQTLPAVS
jgi:putative two-component system response regulator